MREVTGILASTSGIDLTPYGPDSRRVATPGTLQDCQIRERRPIQRANDPGVPLGLPLGGFCEQGVPEPADAGKTVGYRWSLCWFLLAIFQDVR